MSKNHHTKLNVLVSGAGVAGCTVAHFLLRAGHEVTIIERSPALRTSGQNVDIRGHGLTVIQRMKCKSIDVEAAVRAKTTRESGLKFVDSQNRSWADFPVDDGKGFTAEIEIMRGDLSNILYESVENLPGLEVLFDRSVSNIEEDAAGGVRVALDKGWTDQSETRRFDLVVAADGLASAVRSLTFRDEASTSIRSLNQWTCWFSIPRQDTDSSWARWYNGTKGRMILVRPDSGKLTRVSLWTMARDPQFAKSIKDIRKASSAEQKKFWYDHFQKVGWEGERVIDDMLEADDFYMQEVAQVKIDAFCKGRIALVGDAGYCPSPITGMGTTTAIVGAYVLAGEVNTQPEDLSSALKAYTDKMRPFIDVAQKLAPGAPGSANPETAWGIWFVYCVLSFLSWSRLYKLFGASVHPPSQAMQLPLYSMSD